MVSAWNLNLSVFVELKCTALYFRVVLRGCQTWSLTLNEKTRLEVFENVLVCAGLSITSLIFDSNEEGVDLKALLYGGGQTAIL